MKLKQNFSMTKIKLKKASPHIMFVIGVGGIIYTIVKSCIEARTLDEDIAEEIDEVEALKAELEDDEAAASRTDEEEKSLKKALRAARRKAIFKGLKKFAIPAVVGIISIGLLSGSHIILTNKLAVTAAALTATTDEFRAYRAGVIEEYGEEADQKLRYGRTMVEKEVACIDDETGEETVEKLNVAQWREGHSLYAIAFCKTYCGSMFQNDPYHDSLTIQNCRKALETDYENQGIALLSSGYRFLGHSLTKPAIGTGWVKGNPKGDGRIVVTAVETVFEFTPGEFENGYIVDFNVEGRIEDLVPFEPKKRIKASKKGERA